MIYTIAFKSNTPYSFVSACGYNRFKIYIKYDIINDSYFVDVDIYEDGSYKNIISCLSLTCGSDLFFPFSRYKLGQLWILPTDYRFINEVPRADTIVSKFVMVWSHD